MAIDYIKISTDELNKTINNMNSDIYDMKKEIESMYQDVMELDQMWDGKANETFNIQFQNDKQLFIELCDKIVKYITSLGEVKKEYEDCEKSVGNIIKSIRV